jgi:hypothetical protein
VLYAAHTVREESATMKRNYVEEEKLRGEVLAIVGAAARLPGVQLLVKPHPNEATDTFRQAVVEFRTTDIHLVSKSDSPYPFLFVCDAVVTHRSSLAVEGAVLGKPVVVVNFTGTPDAFPYVASGIAAGAYEPGDVEPAIRAVLYDEPTRTLMAERRATFLQENVLLGDVPATDRMVNLVLELAAAHPSATDLVPATVAGGGLA